MFAAPPWNPPATVYESTVHAEPGSLDLLSASLAQDGTDYFDYHHTAADTLDKIVPQELAENAAVVAVTAYALANLEKPLPR